MLPSCGLGARTRHAPFPPHYTLTSWRAKDRIRYHRRLDIGRCYRHHTQASSTIPVRRHRHLGPVTYKSTLAFIAEQSGPANQNSQRIRIRVPTWGRALSQLSQQSIVSGGCEGPLFSLGCGVVLGRRLPLRLWPQGLSAGDTQARAWRIRIRVPIRGHELSQLSQQSIVSGRCEGPLFSTAVAWSL
jgi:hypothetical protein